MIPLALVACNKEPPVIAGWLLSYPASSWSMCVISGENCSQGHILRDQTQAASPIGHSFQWIYRHLEELRSTARTTWVLKMYSSPFLCGRVRLHQTSDVIGVYMARREHRRCVLAQSHQDCLRQLRDRSRSVFWLECTVPRNVLADLATTKERPQNHFKAVKLLGHHDARAEDRWGHNASIKL